MYSALNSYYVLVETSSKGSASKLTRISIALKSILGRALVNKIPLMTTFESHKTELFHKSPAVTYELL